MMKKFTVYANCQSKALARTLLENEEFRSKYEYVPIRAVQSLSEKDVNEVISVVRSIDLFIHQPVQQGRRPKELTSEFLLSQLHESAMSYSFPSLYFDGYFPHLQTFNGYVSVLNLVHDYFIAYLCASGFSESETFDILNLESLYPESLSVDFLKKSISNLKAKEQKFSIDIRVSDFIEQNYKAEKLFNQFNHPKRSIFKYVSECVLERIGVLSSFIDENGPSHLDAIVTPVYKSTYKNLGLSFSEDFNGYKAASQDKHQRQVISEFFDFYKTKDLKEIRTNVAAIKPFIPRLIKNISG
ncbi:WcbI family polysaccharide biosynthesis putative acetyltransferase [Amphritea pacifica]|uniref:Polysaccharide biosynthesis enzyme WcbI domain-containing protein n=1 Tax=Amphritea pacifica TaxID=2811233 RepID=A0ABS2WCH9_9GAMM|nr:WcbI family polysaccharide biosynthesis putative acetyltransferase [Amphritea pacifica]MBN0989321.1 hypothetical protein [Amphritea pacifica]MBN1009111.1 hypothetical protein [Amphritea pacifica]